MKLHDDRPVYAVVSVILILVIVVCGVVMEFGLFGYGELLAETYVDMVISSPASSSEEVLTVNLNTASVQLLETLPGIGPAIAQRILDYRQEKGSFSSVEQLKEIKGIGEKTFEKLKPYVTVE